MSYYYDKNMPGKKIIDLTGKKFNRWTVVEFYKRKNRRTLWKCKCECGKIKNVDSESLKRGKSKSCNCFKKGKVMAPYIDGRSGTKLYALFNSIIARCEREGSSSYKNYGGRGIMCEWEKFIDFKKDMGRSYKYHVKKYGIKNTSIDRIDNDANYCKSNCRWATRKEQSNNRRSCHLVTYKGKTLNITEWSDLLNINRRVLYYRLNNGWGINKALETPVNKKKIYDQRNKQTNSKA